MAVAILMATFHYLVRSALIGRILNGRSYAYRPFFQSDLFRTNGQVAFEEASSKDSALDNPVISGPPLADSVGDATNEPALAEKE